MDILFYFMFINMISLIYCVNVKSAIKLDSSELSTQSDKNKHTKSLLTEGGAVDLDDFNLQDKDNKTSLLVLDQEGVKRKEKPSVRRNGAFLSEAVPLVTEKLTVRKENLNVSSKESENNVHVKSHDLGSSVVPVEGVASDNKPVDSESNVKKTVHKPYVLSSEPLFNSQASSVQDKNMAVQDESLQDINDETKITSKMNAIISKSHPDLVMPVVVLILIVPLFAVFGYMALQKGREAWKNRHYKRMDFLVDGMYNE